MTRRTQDREMNIAKLGEAMDDREIERRQRRNGEDFDHTGKRPFQAFFELSPIAGMQGSLEGLGAIGEMTCAQLGRQLSKEASLPALVACLGQRRRTRPGRDPIGAKREVVIEEIRDPMRQLNESPIGVDRVELTGERREIRLVAAQGQAFRDPPGQTANFPARMGLRKRRIGDRTEDGFEEDPRKGKGRVRTNAIFASDRLRDPSLHPRTLNDDHIGRERILSRRHQPSRETFEKSLCPIATFDEEQARA